MATKPRFSFFQDALHFSQRNPLLILISFLVLFFICLWGIKFSRFELDIYDTLDPNFSSSIDLKEMKENHDDHTQILVYFHFPNHLSAGEACKILKWSQKAASFKEIKSATSLWSIRVPKIEGESLWYKKLLDDPCQLPIDQKIEFNKDYSNSYFRHLVAKTGAQDLVFELSFVDKKLETSKIQNLIEFTESYLKKEMKGVKVHYLGLAGFRYYFKKIMVKDQLISLLVLVILFLLLRIIYGTWISGILLIVTLLFSCVILYGVIALSGAPIDILSNNLFLIMALASTADFIFVSQYQMKHSYQESFEVLAIPCFFTTLTTIMGFLSLNTSNLEIIKRFGNGAALGAILEWMMLFQLIPAVLKFFNKEKVWVNPSKAVQFKWIEKFETFTMPPKMLFIFLLLMVLSIPSYFFLNDQDSPVDNLPKDHVLRLGYEKFTEKFNWQGQVYLYFPEVPDQIQYEKIVKKLSQHDLVYKVEDPHEMTHEWIKNLPVLTGDLVKRELSMTPLWERYYARSGTLRVSLYLKEQDLKAIKRVRDFTQELCQGQCRLAGQRIVYLEYGEKISLTMIQSFAVSILLVILILGILLWSVGKIKHFWPVTLSSLMGPLVILFFMALFQIQVTIVTSIFLAIMVGLTGDNAIQFMMTEDENIKEAIDSRARASVIVSLVMILCSTLFLFQTLKPMKILGLLFIFGFIINLVGDLFGLKGLLKRSIK